MTFEVGGLNAIRPQQQCRNGWAFRRHWDQLCWIMLGGRGRPV